MAFIGVGAVTAVVSVPIGTGVGTTGTGGEGGVVQPVTATRRIPIIRRAMLRESIPGLSMPGLLNLQ
jgi:hypothetical protein